jgi:hypothetical protein
MDVMHCEKIICKNILKYLMDERDKLWVHNDMEEWGIQFQLHLQPIGESSDD